MKKQKKNLAINRDKSILGNNYEYFRGSKTETFQIRLYYHIRYLFLSMRNRIFSGSCFEDEIIISELNIEKHSLRVSISNIKHLFEKLCLAQDRSERIADNYRTFSFSIV